MVSFAETPSFQSCIENHKSNAEYRRRDQHADKENEAVIVLRGRILLNGRCVTHTIYVKHDAIEALAAVGGFFFSFILTISTIFLWWETRNTARAGLKQHETSACWRYDISENRFLLYGGEKYNYTK